MDLFSATVTTVPFLLITLLVDAKVFGPRRAGSPKQRATDLRTDKGVLGALAVAFACSLAGLTFEADAVWLRLFTALGLACGTTGVFAFVFGHVSRMYQADVESKA